MSSFSNTSVTKEKGSFAHLADAFISAQLLALGMGICKALNPLVLLASGDQHFLLDGDMVASKFENYKLGGCRGRAKQECSDLLWDSE